MRTVILGAIFLFCNLAGFSQKNKDKIDSVFKFYFAILKSEYSDSINPSKNPEYYNRIIIDSVKNQIVHTNKFSSKAFVFLADISKIKPARAQISHRYVITPEIVQQWEYWYEKNREGLRWSKRKNKPVRKCSLF